MPVYELPEDEIWFPKPSEFEGDIIGYGGNLEPNRLLSGYSRGIFPWYNDPGDIVWWSPEQRCILYLDKFRLSHSVRNTMNKYEMRVTMDRDFGGVLEGCRAGKRENATWLLDEMVNAYTELHNLGYAHSVEVWHEGKLVGGLYGVCLGCVFFGESMFTTMTNASKIAFAHLVGFLKMKGWKIIDCQVYNDHLASLGAITMPRNEFLELLKQEQQEETVVGKWDYDVDVKDY